MMKEIARAISGTIGPKWKIIANLRKKNLTVQMGNEIISIPMDSGEPSPTGIRIRGKECIQFVCAYPLDLGSQVCQGLRHVLCRALDAGYQLCFENNGHGKKIFIFSPQSVKALVLDLISLPKGSDEDRARQRQAEQKAISDRKSTMEAVGRSF